MQRFKHHWKRLPTRIRRPLVFLLGSLLIVLSALIGWVPGPGGMVPFLLGIAVLATEFAWAQRLRDAILERLKQAGKLARHRPFISAALGISGLAAIGLIAYVFYTNTI